MSNGGNSQECTICEARGLEWVRSVMWLSRGEGGDSAFSGEGFDIHGQFRGFSGGGVLGREGEGVFKLLMKDRVAGIRVVSIVRLSPEQFVF